MNLTRETHHGSGSTLPNRKPDILKQLHLKAITRFACKTGGLHILIDTN